MLKFLAFLLILIFAATPAFAVSTGSCYDTDTKLMMHFDGANGSTTFTDSSASAHSFSRTGSTPLISTAQSVFGGASFNVNPVGLTDYIYTADSSDWDFSTGDFTFDARVYFTTIAAGATHEFLSMPITAANGFTVAYEVDTTSLLSYMEATVRAFTSWSASINTWYHVAVTRSGTNLRGFVNGTQVSTTITDSTDIQVADILTIGGDGNITLNGFQGYLDELRLVKGTAVWTANFTPSASAYTDCAASSGSQKMFFRMHR